MPLALQRAFQERHGVQVLQAWGMTETSPLATIAHAAGRGRRRTATRAGATAPPRAARSPASPPGSSATTARSCPATASRSASSRSAARGSPASYYKDDDAREVPRRLAADRRRRHHRPPRLHHPHRPGQGRHQVRRRVDLLGRPGEPPDGPPRRPRGRGGRDPRREVGRAPARHRRAARGRLGRPRLVARAPRHQVRQVAAPRRWAFIESVPRTSVGKFDKKVIRQDFADGALDVKRL